MLPMLGCVTKIPLGLSCIKDEGGPLGAAVQEEASNRHKLLLSKAMVVSVCGKGAAMIASDTYPKEANASEPLMRCRKPW